MNPYEANLTNTTARLAAWVRGMTRRYRQPLLALAAGSAVMAIGVSATRAPAQSPRVATPSPPAAEQRVAVRTIAMRSVVVADPVPAR